MCIWKMYIVPMHLRIRRGVQAVFEINIACGNVTHFVQTYKLSVRIDLFYFHALQA